MRSYVINLKRRPDRLRNFIFHYDMAKMNSNDTFVYHGFDITEPTDNFNDFKISKFSESLSNGAKGCFISHISVYKEFLKSGEEYGLIFEDDLFFCKNFKERFLTVIDEFKRLESDSDIYMLYIGGRFIPEFCMKPENFIKKSEHIVQSNFSGSIDIHKKADVDRTTHSYIITREGAEYLVQQFEKTDLIDTPIDHWLINVLPNETVYHSYPLLCHSPLFSDSDVFR